MLRSSCNRSSSPTFKPSVSTYIAGLAINRKQTSVFITFSGDAGRDNKYSGSFDRLTELHPLYFDVPKDMPADLEKGLRLIELIKQLPEFKTTTRIVTYSPGVMGGEWEFRDFMRKNKISYHDCTYQIQANNLLFFPSMEKLSKLALRECKSRKAGADWCEKHGY